MAADGPPGIVDILAPVAVDTAYSYRAPPELKLAPGDVVAMPLGTRTAFGVVWAARSGDGGNLKSVTARLPVPPVAAPLRDFVDWIARWTLSPRGSVLRMALRTPERAEPAAPRLGYALTGKPPAKPTAARAKALAALADGATLAKAE
ncbi:MAG: primosomal protein N', partial [Pseudomonadota bacterium]|nr:primosomal protein N' [Pseudomonadota bacterium]